jgi:hypothetical protein
MEQEVLLDEIILDLSGIDKNAAIPLDWESFKPDCVFWPNLKREPLALWRDSHSGIEAIHRNKQLLKILKRVGPQGKRIIYLM